MRKKFIICLLFISLLSLIFLGVQKIPSFQHNPFAALVSGFFPFWQKNQPSIPDENINLGVNQDISAELAEKLDDREEQIDVLNQKIAELEKELEYFKNKTLTMGDAEELADEEELEEEDDDEDEEEIAEEAQKTEKKLCEKISGAQPLRNKIIINEVAWMGGSSSVSDEWIEIKNIFGVTISLENWQILDKDQQIKTVFSDKEKTTGNSLFLLERTDDNSVPGIAADFIYTGSLENSQEDLYLFDENCQLQDEVLTEPDWPAGDNSSKRTMERKSDLSWQTSYEPGGTPKRENSNGYIVIPPAGAGGGSSSSGQQTQPKITLSYSEDNPANKEIEAILSVSDIKNALYDVKISVENEGTVLSEIYNQKENKWQLSFYYLKELFSGDSFEGKFQLRIKEEMKEFRGEADVIARVRENDKTNYYEFIGKINITDPEQEPNQPPIASFTFSPQNPFVGEEIIFDASSSTDLDGQIISFTWDFGDDSSITTNQATTTHSYSTSTDFTIGLQVIDNKEAVSALATSTIFVAETGVPFSELGVVINEIAWMGTDAGGDYEWIELYNNKKEKIDISGWKIENAGAGNKTLEISAGEIPLEGFFLICKKEIENCDFIIGALSLHNEYEKNGKLVLRDNLSNIIDQTPEPEGKNWPAGNNSTKQTMERINPSIPGNNSDNWATSLNPGGTPKAQNSQYIP